MNAYVLGYAAYSMNAALVKFAWNPDKPFEVVKVAGVIRNPFTPKTLKWKEWEEGYVDAFIDQDILPECRKRQNL